MSDEPKPPTDTELKELEADLHWKAAEGGPQEPPIVSAALALRLVAEVRRLRGVGHELRDGKPLEVVRLAMAVDPEGFIGVRVRDLAALWRLRSDEWLEKAVKEIGDQVEETFGLATVDDLEHVDMIAILRKHRDGKA